jgi:hypothetical protein
MPGQFELLLHDMRVVAKADDGAQAVRFWGVASTGALDRQNEKITQKAIDAFKVDYVGKPLCVGTHAEARVNPLLAIGMIDKCAGEGDVLEVEGYFDELHPYYPMINKALSNAEWPVDWKMSIGGKVVPGGRHMTWDAGKAVSVIEEMEADHILLCRADAAVNQETMFSQAGKASDETLADVVFKAGADVEAIDLTGKIGDGDPSPSISEGIDKSEEGDDMSVLQRIRELLDGAEVTDKVDEVAEPVVVVVEDAVDKSADMSGEWETLQTALAGIASDPAVDKTASIVAALDTFKSGMLERLGVVVDKVEVAEDVAEKVDEPVAEEVADKADEAEPVTMNAFKVLLDAQAELFGSQLNTLVGRVNSVETQTEVLGKAVAPVADAIGKASGSGQVEPEATKPEVKRSSFMWADENPLTKSMLEKNTNVLYGE